MSEEYFITELDVLLMAYKYNISILVIPAVGGKQTRKKITTINLYPSKYDETGNYYLISNSYRDLITKFKIITDSSDWKTNLNSLQLLYNSKSDIEIKIADNSNLNIKDFVFETHLFNKENKIKVKKNLKLAES